MDRSNQIERQLEARQSRRLKAEDRYLNRLEAKELKAYTLIGMLFREGKTVYYINLLRKGQYTGKTKESTSYGELVNYLIRNNYV